MAISESETPLYFASASLLRVLLHQFVRTGETPAERATIQKDIFDQVMRDISRANTDKPTREAAESVVLEIFGISGNRSQN